MKSREHYETLSALRYAQGVLDYVKKGKTNNSLIRREVLRGEKIKARLSRPKKTRCDYEN